MDGLSLSDGRSMKVGIVKECNDSINNLYIKNIPGETFYRIFFRLVLTFLFTESIDENVLESLFKKYGSIVSTTIMKDEECKSRGFGFVCFQNEVHAAVAKKDMHGFEISGKKFDISFAQKKENREAFLTAQKKGILRQAEPIKKFTRLPLEMRAIRRPTKFELASYNSVPCLEQLPPFGNMYDWERTRLMSSSMMKMPTMAEVFVRSNPSFANTGPPGNVARPRNMNNNNSQSGQKSGYQRTFRSSANYQSKPGNTGASQKPVEKPTNEKPESANPGPSVAQDRKVVLQDILLPQLKKLYPPYATEIMDRLMEREYKDVLRLAGNYRLLYKTASNEVQKIKAKANGSKHSKN